MHLNIHPKDKYNEWIMFNMRQIISKEKKESRRIRRKSYLVHRPRLANKKKVTFLNHRCLCHLLVQRNQAVANFFAQATKIELYMYYIKLLLQ